MTGGTRKAPRSVAEKLFSDWAVSCSSDTQIRAADYLALIDAITCEILTEREEAAKIIESFKDDWDFYPGQLDQLAAAIRNKME